MSISLKINLGTINYLDFIHVQASKVSAPSTTVWETWIDVPVTNYNFIIPGLDPENYYIRYYDAPTNTSLGTLVAELIVNALTNEFISERRFYTVGGSGTYDPADGATGVTDPYLIGKTVSGVFKEGFRYFDPATEYIFTDATGNVNVTNGTLLATDEKIIIELTYVAGAETTTSSTSLYDSTINVPEATRTLLAAEINARVRLTGTAATQAITLPALPGFAIDKGFYFDNSVGGMAIQVKLLTNGTDRVRFNGFNSASNLFPEFWVSKGEHLLIRKFDDNFWEVIGDYKGVNVGEKVNVSYKSHPNVIPEDGSEIDGNEYGRLWWWINNVLPATHYISDDSGTQQPSRIGQFIIKPTTKKILMPNSQNLSEKGLADFNSYGSDSVNRLYDYPGGFQDQALMSHGHSINTTSSGPTSNDTGDPMRGNIVGTSNTRGQAGANKSIGLTGGTDQRVKNIGVIYGRRI